MFLVTSNLVHLQHRVAFSKLRSITRRSISSKTQPPVSRMCLGEGMDSCVCAMAIPSTKYNNLNRLKRGFLVNNTRFFVDSFFPNVCWCLSEIRWGTFMWKRNSRVSSVYIFYTHLDILVFKYSCYRNKNTVWMPTHHQNKQHVQTLSQSWVDFNNNYPQEWIY